MRNFFVVAIFLLVYNIGKATAVQNAVALLQNKLHIIIRYDTVIADRWGAVTYDVPADSQQILRYLTLMERELGKYPENYLSNALADNIILCTNLNYFKQNRAAVPAPEDHAIYLGIDGAYGVDDDTYLVHVMHHELNHCADYALWKDMFYRWKPWGRSNRLLFKYKGAGAMAYNDLSIDWYGMVHPKTGFVNLYSTTAQEEDRAEIVSLIMSDIERPFLVKYSPDDKKLKRKIALAVKFLNKVSGTTQNYWSAVSAQLLGP